MTTPVIYVFFGLIASGKSTLSELFAAQHGYPCYNTDRVRKELAGIAANERKADGLNKGIYSPEFTLKTYQAMLDLAAADMSHGVEGVVLDGSYSKRGDRKQVIELATRAHGSSLFILCNCSDAVVQERLAQRANDPDAVSDGRWEIFVRQKQSFEFPAELGTNQLLDLNTEIAPDRLVERVEQFCINQT